MNDKIKINSLCGKILLFLYFKDNLISADKLLYFIAICDFSNNGDFDSKSVRNINSYVYYLKDFSTATSLLVQTGLVSKNGNAYLITSIGTIFCEEIIENEINNFIIDSIKETLKYCENIGDLSVEYQKLSSFFLNNLKDKKL